MSTDLSLYMKPEALAFAETISKSDFCPAAHKGKPGNVLVALQMGSELGLPMLSSLQNIAVINGKPAIYGDGMVALVRASGQLEYMNESCDGQVATCTVKRRGQPEATVQFTLAQAKQAGLLNKSGPWTQYTNRMLQMRARGYALRDQFADILQGLISAEEASDLVREERDITPPAPTRTEELKQIVAPAAAPAEPAAPSENEGAFGDLLGDDEQLLSDVEHLCARMREASTIDQLNQLAIVVPEVVPEGQLRDECKRAYTAAKKRLMSAQRAEEAEELPVQE